MKKMIKEMLDEFDYDIFVSKKLYKDDDLTDKYYTLLSNYKILFEKYLMDKIPLKDMDSKIINSGLSFIPVGNDKMDFYQKFSGMGLKYIYLRNNLYVYKLSLDDIDRVVNLSKKELDNPSEDLMNFIDDTYKIVIDARPLGEDVSDDYRKCYGNDYWVKYDELVIGVRYDEFADNDLGENDDWIDNYNKQLEFLGNLMIGMENSCSDLLGLKVNFLYFDDNSVRKTMGRMK